jgi:hypothetical protein
LQEVTSESLDREIACTRPCGAVALLGGECGPERAGRGDVRSSGRVVERPRRIFSSPAAFLPADFFFSCFCCLVVFFVPDRRSRPSSRGDCGSFSFLSSLSSSSSLPRLRLLCDIALRLSRNRLDPELLCRGVEGPDDDNSFEWLAASGSPATLASTKLVWVVGVCSRGDLDSDRATELGRRRLFDEADDVTDHECAGVDGTETAD